MACSECERLNGLYQYAVRVYAEAVEAGKGALDDDLKLAFRTTEQLYRKCLEAGDLVAAHIHSEHKTIPFPLKRAVAEST